MLFVLLIYVKMPTIVGILTFMGRKNFMLNSLEHEKSFITSGPGKQIGSLKSCFPFIEMKKKQGAVPVHFKLTKTIEVR